MQEQREAKPLHFTVRDLTREDLAELQGERRPLTVAKMRDTHHRVARLIASGLRTTEVAERTGYSLQTLSNLRRDPAFEELVALYREKVIEAYVTEEQEFISDAVRLRTKALRVIENHFDAADDPDAEPIPLSKALAVAEFTADRTGFGKQSTKLNVNADFAAMLERAHASRMKVVESRAVAPSTPVEVEPGSNPANPPHPAPAIQHQPEVRVPAPRLAPPRAPGSAPVERAAEPFRRRA